MKLSVSLIICLIVFSLVAQGQSKFEVGIRGGLSYSSFYECRAEMFPNVSGQYDQQNYFMLDYETNLREDVEIGGQFFLYANYLLSKKAALQLGIGYNQKGINLEYVKDFYRHVDNPDGTNTVSMGSFTFTRKIEHNYISCPLGLKYTLGEKNIFFAKGGIYVGYLLTSDINGFSGHGLVEIRSTEDGPEILINNIATQNLHGESLTPNQSHTNPIDFGLTAGGGVQFPIHSGLTFTFSIDIEYGLIQLDSQHNNDTKIYPSTSGWSTTHENYHRLNSHAKNISLGNSIGVIYKFQ